MKRCLISKVSFDVPYYSPIPWSTNQRLGKVTRRSALCNTPLEAVEMNFFCPAPSVGGEGQEKIQQPPEGSMDAQFGSKTTCI